jgi:PhnB protein
MAKNAKKASNSEPTQQQAAMPEILSGVVPYLEVKGASAAAEFYGKAFGAREVYRQSVDEQGRTMHIHLYINGGSVMLSDAFPEHGHPHREPQGYTLHMKVDDGDRWWQRAVDAGATIVLPLQLMFWGERYGQLRDPFGVLWSISAAGNE